MLYAELHQIQQQILTKLMQAPGERRYSELMVDEVENDLFNYHLQQLVKVGFIAKSESGYTLSESGQKAITHLDALGNPRQFFKVSVALMVFQNEYSELLVQKRLRNPFYGEITTVAGKVLPGEKVVDAARRKLLEEANLAALFTFVGVLRKIKRNSERMIFEDVFYHYCVASEPVGVLSEKNEFGENYWIRTSEFIELEKMNNVDSGELDLEVGQRLINKDFSSFYLEQDRVVERY